MLTGFQNLTSKIISLTPTNKVTNISTETNGRNIAFEYEVDTPADAVDTTAGENVDYEGDHEDEEEERNMHAFHSEDNEDEDEGKDNGDDDENK